MSVQTPLIAGAAAQGATADTYTQLADLQIRGTDAKLARMIPLTSVNGSAASGDDAIEVVQGVVGTTGALLVAVQAVIHQSGGDQRSLLTLNYGQANPIAEIPLNTEGAVSLAATQDRTVNVIAFEEEYQLAWVGANATALDPTDVAPLQVAPSALMVNQRGDMRNVLVYNAASPSVTTLSVDYVFNKRAFNMKALADYRAEWMGVLNEILRRLLQRVKDCVCEHLLVDCPTCDETDRLILACVEIRAKQVYNICNFHRREVVTFPKLFYWLSAIPIIPLVTAAIERVCCAALARPSASLNKEGTSIVSAKVLNQNAVRLQTVDFDLMQKALSSYLKMTSSFGAQALVRKLGGEGNLSPGGTCGRARESNVRDREADAGAVRRERQPRHSDGRGVRGQHDRKDQRGTRRTQSGRQGGSLHAERQGGVLYASQGRDASRNGRLRRCRHDRDAHAAGERSGSQPPRFACASRRADRSAEEGSGYSACVAGEEESAGAGAGSATTFTEPQEEREIAAGLTIPMPPATAGLQLQVRAPKIGPSR